VETLRSLFTTADALLAVSPEDLAPVLLQLARSHAQGAGFWPDSILNEQSLTGEPDTGYPYDKKARVEAHVNEAWQSLQRDGFIAPSPGQNGRNAMVGCRSPERAKKHANPPIRLSAFEPRGPFPGRCCIR
jgi:hypothetical protein